MAIYSRRTLLRVVNENAKFIGLDLTNKHLANLDRGDLGTEWEVIFINAFSKLGVVEHHKLFNNTTPDIYYIPTDGSARFIADVRTVSFKEAHEQNPVRNILFRLSEIEQKENLSGSFGVEFGSDSKRIFHRDKRKLLLAELADIDREIFGEEFRSFLRKIKASRRSTHELHISKPYILKNGTKDKIELTITYARHPAIYSSHLSYTQFSSIEKNVIWNSLNDKYKKLKMANVDFDMGIILCDGGCDEIARIVPSNGGKSVDEIIEHFMIKKSRLSFVVVARAQKSWKGHLEIQLKVFKNPGLDKGLEDSLTKLANEKDIFCKPERDVINAVLKAKSTKGSSFCGGSKMKMNEIKISSRTISEYLAGRISLPETDKAYFRKKAEENRLIKNISIEKMTDEDDDWIAIEFSEPDVAVSSFVMPESK